MKPRKSEHSDSYTSLESPVGRLYLIFSGSALAGITFNKKPQGLLFRESSQTRKVASQLEEYFSQSRTAFTCPIVLTGGTDFEMEVWQELKNVPYGETRTYKWLAERIGHPDAFRAVGNALGKNPIPIIIPCHRIIESDGSIGGYSSGIDIKRRLLEIEYYTKLSRS